MVTHISQLGEVALHRLNWQRVWLLTPPVEEVRVTALSWRPDGRVLVAAYNNSKLPITELDLLYELF